jgi:deoxycytidine triphosphate deaminase
MTVLLRKNWKRKLKKEQLLICPDPFINESDRSKMRGMGLNLRVGAIALIKDDFRSREGEWQINGSFALKDGRSAIVVTYEQIFLGLRLCGLLTSKGSITNRGLMVQSGTVDPTYRGPLRLIITNISGNTITINNKEEICTLVLQTTKSKSIDILDDGHNSPHSLCNYDDAITLWRDKIHPKDSLAENFEEEANYLSRVYSGDENYWDRVTHWWNTKLISSRVTVLSCILLIIGVIGIVFKWNKIEVWGFNNLEIISAIWTAFTVTLGTIIGTFLQKNGNK